MDVNIINPFLTACENAFVNMFNLAPQHKDPYLLDAKSGHTWEISGLLGLTGDCDGVVAFRLHKILASKMLELSGIKADTPEEREELAKQLVSEFTNIISGNAISQIKNKNISVSPPVVVTGEDHMLSWPKNYPIVAIPFVTKHGPFEVDVCFK
ncbi:MAG: chemotaxis protein CheX [Treponema sp.]|nr:chemotaxis protein CheX [Treponema sp.]